jgi:hypothetical protein
VAAVKVYPEVAYDPWSRTEQCRAEIIRPRRTPPRRCENRAPAEGPDRGLCWRHR